jgi:phosphoglycerol transferase MdoB-like AlkP superfamily enzyme
MNTPYVSSPYAGNKIGSLAKTLKKKGYNSAFFHGGNNGTMGFNAFTTMAGIEAYYGRSEYPDQNDFDGNWGIYDEPFFQFFAEKLDGFESPFFATFFSLSSHHPYSIPSQYTNRFPKGELEIHETIGYTDMALGKFFNRIKEASWYNNSIFLITADHTAQSIAPEYKTNVGMYALPFIVFDPSTNVQDFNTNTSQQADIPAIVLDLLNYSGTVLSFGKNPLQEGDKSFCVNYNNGIYQFISKGYCLRFDGSASIGLYHLTKDPLLSVNLLEEEPFIKQTMERSLKAIIQSYNDRLINNRWQLNE